MALTFNVANQLFLLLLLSNKCFDLCKGWCPTWTRPTQINLHLSLSQLPKACVTELSSLSLSSSSDEGNKRNKSTVDSVKQRSSRDELLIELDKAFDYEGRLPSKLASGPIDTTTTKKTQSPSDPSPFRCGFVSIIGAANMGKSTLLNALLQEDLCIATRRPQTTRHAILGLLSTPYSQVCLLDTPGVLDGPAAYKLQERMMEAVKGAVNSADILLVVTDMFSTPLPDYDALFQRVQKSRKPVIVAINKIDLEGRSSPSKPRSAKTTSNDINDTDGEEIEKTHTVADAVAKWRKLLPNALAIIPLCAMQPHSKENKSTGDASSQHPGVHLLRQILVGADDIPASIRALGRPIPGVFQPGVKFLHDEDVKSLLPESPPLYDEDSISDRSERFFVSELIRESLFESLKKELPYSCEVQVMNFTEPRGTSRSQKTQIEAAVFVERESQKIIVVGKGGEKIKEIGIRARQKIERFLGDERHVNLRLQVRVRKDWRKKDDQLKEFGYQQST